MITEDTTFHGHHVKIKIFDTATAVMKLQQWLDNPMLTYTEIRNPENGEFQFLILGHKGFPYDRDVFEYYASSSEEERNRLKTLSQIATKEKELEVLKAQLK